MLCTISCHCIIFSLCYGSISIFAIRPFYDSCFAIPIDLTFQKLKKKCLLLRVNEFIQTMISTRKISIYKMRFEQFFQRGNLHCICYQSILHGCCHCWMRVCASITCIVTSIKLCEKVFIFFCN